MWKGFHFYSICASKSNSLVHPVSRDRERRTVLSVKSLCQLKRVKVHRDEEKRKRKRRKIEEWA